MAYFSLCFVFTQEAYGSYETCNDPRFSSTNISLYDRGVVVAIAHVRGGGEMGRHWCVDVPCFRAQIGDARPLVGPSTIAVSA